MAVRNFISFSNDGGLNGRRAGRRKLSVCQRFLQLLFLRRQIIFMQTSRYLPQARGEQHGLEQRQKGVSVQ